MRPALILLICGLFIGGCQTTAWLPTLNEGPWKGSTSFVEGSVEMTDLITSGEGDLVSWGDFEVNKKSIWGVWVHHDTDGGMEIRMTEKGPIVYWFDQYVYDFNSSTMQVGRDLHVKTTAYHEHGETDFAFTLKGVFADDAPIPWAAQLKPNSKKVTPQSPANASIEKRLRELRKLVDDGLVTPDEAAAKRKEILNSL